MFDPDVIVKCPVCRRDVPETFVLRDGKTCDVLQCWDCEDAEREVEKNKREQKRVKTRLTKLRNGSLKTPMLDKPMQPYISPECKDGTTIISDRRQRRDDMRAHGCIDANDIRPPNAGKFKNDRFIEKHGLHEFRAED